MIEVHRDYRDVKVNRVRYRRKGRRVSRECLGSAVLPVSLAEMAWTGRKESLGCQASAGMVCLVPRESQGRQVVTVCQDSKD